MNFSALFIKRPVATILLTLAVAMAGVLSFFLLPIAPLPQVDYPTITVSAYLPGADAETAAATLATPLERALGSIAGVNEMTSYCYQGGCNITLQFDLSRNIDASAREVQAAILASRSMLPSGMPGNPTYRKVNPADAPIMILALTSDTLSRGQMFDTASTLLAQRLSQVQGIGQVNISGGALPAVRVALDPNRLSSTGISLEEVRNAIVATSGNRPKGLVESDTQHWQITGNDQAHTAADFAQTIVRQKNGSVVRLSDVADVVDSVENTRNIGLANGKRAILLMLNKAPDANIIQAVASVRALLPGLRASIPPTISLEVVSDRTPPIRASLREMEKALAIAIGLVVVVVMLFLRSVRLALIPAVAVPVSLCGTFCVMYLCGYSLDNLSLMALTVATGFVVDDAIVVLDNTKRHVDHGMAVRRASFQGAREIGFTIVSISLSLMAVFIPILLMGGVVGRLFHEFAVVLSAAILVSMVVSLTTTPMMCSLLLRPPKTDVRLGWYARFGNALGHAVQNGYRKSLGWALRHQPVTLLVFVAAIGLNVFLYNHIDKGFFPQSDSGRINGGISVDQATSFQATVPRLERILNAVREDPAVEHATGYAYGASAQINLSLKPLAQRGVTSEEVITRLRQRFEKEPGANVYFFLAQDIRIGGWQSNSSQQYQLQADSLEDLRIWEPRIRRAMQQLPEIADVGGGGQQARGLQTTLTIDRDAAARLGLSVRSINTTLNNAFGQRQVGVIYNPLNQYRVVMELGSDYQQGPEALHQLMFTNNVGAQVPLAAFATTELTSAPQGIRRKAGSPAATIGFNLPEGVTLSEATAAVENAVAELGVPVSVRGEFSGTSGALAQALSSQPMLILAALVTIYLVLGVLYESLVHPITILTTLPSAGIGALLALKMFDKEFSIIAMIGIILLIGIVKKNAIMMIDFAIAKQHNTGATAAQAIYHACHMRLRPILMTTTCAIFGAVPLVIGSGDGAELRQPLGITVVGGLILSQLLTLYTTPVVFVAMDRLRSTVVRLVRPAAQAAQPTSP